MVLAEFPPLISQMIFKTAAGASVRFLTEASETERGIKEKKEAHPSVITHKLPPLSVASSCYLPDKVANDNLLHLHALLDAGVSGEAQNFLPRCSVTSDSTRLFILHLPPPPSAG